MKKVILLSTAFLVIFYFSLQAQERNCGAMEHLHNLQQQDPQLSDRMREIEQYTQQWAAAHPNGSGTRAVVTIPVVVHVVYNATAENVSDAQIQSQLAVLNKDFSKTNTDASLTPSVWQSIAANAEVQFCLATVDPNGNSTTGVTRTATSVTSFSTNDNMKRTANGGRDAWDATKYLNIWVCDLGSGLLGYAQFPGGPASTDGVVIDYQAFGTLGTAAAPFNLGRTATHEVGHWLNLYHIWGDDGNQCAGSDNVSDTPNQADENYGCPSFPIVSCSNGPNGDMFMNYMDYTDDACMYLFTNGQKTRMQSLFAAGGARYSLLSSNGCGVPPPPSACATPSGLSVSNLASTTATLNWGAVSGATSYTARIKTTSSSTWTNGTTTGTSLNVSGLAAGTQYEFQVQAVCGTTTGNFSASAFFTTVAAGCSDAYESNETQSAAKTIPVNATIQALISSSTDVDWFKFSNTSTQRRIKVTLTNLPADYDVALYNSSGRRLKTSQNGGTTSETIVYNTNTVATYYIRVYGYNGASSATQCYSLLAQISSSSFRETDEDYIAFEEEASGIRALYPTPASGFVMVNYFSAAEKEINYHIIDMTGKVIASNPESVAAGENLFKLDTGNLSSGIYLLRIQDGNENFTQRFLISK